jgi:uncharacterized membrane protein YhaH (DUF805 family)
MDGRIDWSELFFSSSGRSGRTPSVVAALLLIVLTAIYESLVNQPLHWITGWIVYPLLLFSGACVLSKRLHDRGKSGWWAALVLFAAVMVWPHPDGVLDFLGLIVIAWAVVELSVIPGEQGSNRFGPNPQKPAPVEARA